jgi:PAS domain S-box-containing protein
MVANPDSMPTQLNADLLMQNCPDGVLAFDLNCRYTHWNAAMEILADMPASQVLGKIAFEIFPFLKEIGEDRHFLEALEGRPSVSRRRPFQIPSTGRKGHFEGHYSPVRNAKGEIVGGMAIIRDVSERVQNEVNERFRVLAEHAPFSIQLYRLDGQCTYANPAWENFWISRREELQNYNVFIDPNIDNHGIRELVTKAFRGEPVTLPDIYYDPASIGKVGRPRWLRAHFFPIQNSEGKLIEIGEVAQDVSDTKALMENEERFRSLANALPQLVWMADPEGYIFWYNQRWYGYTGTTPEQMEGWGWKSVHDPTLVDEVVERWTAAVKSGEPFEMEFPLRGADGKFRAFLTRVNPIRDSNGKIVRWLGTNTDVHELKQTREELSASVDMLRTLNSLGRSFSEQLDLDKLVQAITDVATKLTGAQFGALFYNVTKEGGDTYALYTLSGVAREAFSKFPMPRNTAVFGPTFAGEGAVRSDDITKDSRYGKNAPYHGMPEGHLPVRSYLAIPVISRTGTVLGGLFFGHALPGIFTAKDEDFVHGLAAQAAVAIDNAQLFQKAQEAIRTRDSFLSIASHELRTPVTSMKLQTQIMKRSILKEDPTVFSPERVSKMVNQTDRSLDRLARLIDDMLDVSRIQAGKLSLIFEDFALDLLIHEVLERLEAQLAAAKIEVELEIQASPKGRWDRHRLDQVLTNLVTNAIRYAPGGPLKVRVMQRANRAVLEIEDRGPGIDKENHARIFQRFERLISANEISGMGLGLYIVKEIVLAHEGQIWVESEAGQGAKFIVELPLESEVARL